MRYLLLLALLASGCTQTAAKGLADADALHEAARAYVREIHDARREVRRLCWGMLMAEVKQLEADGKSAEARSRLKENYPPLVTVDVALQLIKDPEGFSTQPFGCD